MESLTITEIIANYFSHLIVALASILSAISATYFTLKGQLKRDERNRLYEQRKVAYKTIIDFFMDVLKEGKLKSKKFNEVEINKRFFDILKPLLIYGSSSVMKKYRMFKSLGIQNEKNKIDIICAMEDVLIEIRKKLNPKENLKRGDILSLIVNDWKDVENQIKMT